MLFEKIKLRHSKLLYKPFCSGRHIDNKKLKLIKLGEILIPCFLVKFCGISLVAEVLKKYFRKIPKYSQETLLYRTFGRSTFNNYFIIKRLILPSPNSFRKL